MGEDVVGVHKFVLHHGSRFLSSSFVSVTQQSVFCFVSVDHCSRGRSTTLSDHEVLQNRRKNYIMYTFRFYSVLVPDLVTEENVRIIPIAGGLRYIPKYAGLLLSDLLVTNKSKLKPSLPPDTAQLRLESQPQPRKRSVPTARSNLAQC